MPNFRTRESVVSAPKKRRIGIAEHPVYGAFRLRSLTPRESNTIQAKHLIEDEPESKLAAIVATNCRYIVQVVINEDNESQMFTDDDVEALLDDDNAFITWLATECQKHAGTDPKADENAIKK
jgi:hypothetical protein